MITQFDAFNLTVGNTGSEWTVVPMEQLVQEVYAASQPDARALMLAKLVGKVFETAPVSMRVHMLEHLMRPVGVLALIAIVDGIFARIRFRSGWPATNLRLEDVQSVQSDDVVALVQHAVHNRADALNGLTSALLEVPHMADTGAAAVLLAILSQRTHDRQVELQQGQRLTSQYAAH